MIETSPEIAKLAAALHKAQAVMGGAVKDAKNPAFKSKYATLETVIDAAKPALNEAGVFFTQAPGSVSETLLDVTTMLIHAESGQWMRSTVQVPLPKRDPQGLGSAITYARRYALMSVLGMPAEDDDGNAASGPVQKQDEGPDWKSESRDLSRMVNGARDLNALSVLWKTPRVQDFIRMAPADLSEALLAIKDSRKLQLTPAQEAAE